MTEQRLTRETGPALRVATLAEPVLEGMGFRLGARAHVWFDLANYGGTARRHIYD